MTVKYADNLVGTAFDHTVIPDGLADGRQQGGNKRCMLAVITLASQATTDTIVLGKLPKGAQFLKGWVVTDTSLGTSTIAIGITGTVAKYKAAAVLTATETPTPFGKADAVFDGPLTADETVFITIAVAALPASGELCVEIEYAIAN